VAVDAADAGKAMAEAAGLGDFGDVVFNASCRNHVQQRSI
jgi:hypothetical protein